MIYLAPTKRRAMEGVRTYHLAQPSRKKSNRLSQRRLVEYDTRPSGSNPFYSIEHHTSVVSIVVLEYVFFK
jgi:hypothetical protein